MNRARYVITNVHRKRLGVFIIKLQLLKILQKSDFVIGLVEHPVPPNLRQMLTV